MAAVTSPGQPLYRTAASQPGAWVGSRIRSCQINAGFRQARPPFIRPVETELWKVAAKDPDAQIIERAARAIRGGKLVGFPTETVYGLGANAHDAAAVDRIFEAKGRPSNNPVIVHIVDRNVLQRIVSAWPAEADLLARYFWPGPLTLVLPKRASVPDNVTGGAPTVAVRVPNHPVALALLARCECAIAAPSANPSTAVSPTTAKHVLAGLGGKIDGLLDAGPCAGGIESTVLSLVGQPRILRPGLLHRTAIESVLGTPVLYDVQPSDLHEPLASPGQMPRHYSPATPLELVEGSGWLRVERLLESGRRVGWMTFGPAAAQGVSHPRLVVKAMSAEPAAYANRLYASLHELDSEKLDRIVCARPPDREPWVAVLDRLQRAAAQSQY